MRRTRATLKTLRWVFAAALLLLGTGCIKVRHLGDDVGKSFNKTFRQQRRRTDPDSRVYLKPMEAELATAAANVLAGEKSKNAARNAPRTFTLPASNRGDN